jgi:hypothetical protein
MQGDKICILEAIDRAKNFCTKTQMQGVYPTPVARPTSPLIQDKRNEDSHVR